MDFPIRRALIAVYDKTGVAEFARALVDEFGVEIISTGGTAKHLQQAGIPVTLVEQVTGFPELLDGRVKTLHPMIHAAILADRDNPEHMRQLAEHGIRPIDMVVVNLYPFEQTIARPECTPAEAIEMIDIGGPCLLRAAAKNHRYVVVCSSADGYETLLGQMRQFPESLDLRARRDLAWGAYWDTARYDAAVATWMSINAMDGLPGIRAIHLHNWGAIRYGENPHQKAELLGFIPHRGGLDLTIADVVEDVPQQGEMSHNNYLDADAALQLCADLSRAAATTATGAWRRFSTGDRAAGFQPAASSNAAHRSAFEPIRKKQWTQRDLPHLQSPGETYFVTFRLSSGILSDDERDVVLAATQHWHGEKMTLHAVMVMPDHVHLLLTPHETADGGYVSLTELLHSIKRHSAQEINRRRGESGPLWQREFFDRVVRDEAEFAEKWNYMEANPVTARIAQPGEYRWFWRSKSGFREQLKNSDGDRLKTGPTQHRLETGATRLPETGTVRNSEAGATRPAACCFIKHTNPCGVGIHADPVEAYRRAYLGDSNAAMGGILAGDFQVTAPFAEAVMDSLTRWGKEAGAGAFFVEVWVAPTFAEDAVQVIRTRKPWGQKVRLLDVGSLHDAPPASAPIYRTIAGGLLAQSPDNVGLNEEQWKVVTRRAPDEREMADLRLAWLIAKHTKSNAISLCRDGMLIGNGAGQMSRVMSCRIATWLAKENRHAEKLAGAVAASDAFFPFRDGPDLLIDAGVTAIIQPGGSKRDDETIAACDERGVAMIVTGTRHFRH